MPNITAKCNVTLTASQKDAIKTKLGKAIETLPGKTEAWLMVVIEDGLSMYFKGSPEPCALVEVEILGKAAPEYYEKMTGKLTDIISDELSIPPDRIYCKYEEFTYWGWNGSNF